MKCSTYVLRWCPPYRIFWGILLEFLGNLSNRFRTCGECTTFILMMLHGGVSVGRVCWNSIWQHPAAVKPCKCTRNALQLPDCVLYILCFGRWLHCMHSWRFYWHFWSSHFCKPSHASLVCFPPYCQPILRCVLLSASKYPLENSRHLIQILKRISRHIMAY